MKRQSDDDHHASHRGLQHTRNTSSEDSKVTKRQLTDEESRHGNSLFEWTRFKVSLYYNKLGVHVFGFLSGWKWYDRIDDTILLGALPTSSLIRKLHDEASMSAVINMCAEFPGLSPLYDELMIEQIRLETEDFTIPSMECINKGIAEIKRIKQESPMAVIYLHCKGGKGRSAAMALCYLVHTYCLNIEEGQSVLLRKRPQVDDDLFLKDTIISFYENTLREIELGNIQRTPFE